MLKNFFPSFMIYWKDSYIFLIATLLYLGKIGSTENLSASESNDGGLQRVPSLPKSQRHRSGIPIYRDSSKPFTAHYRCNFFLFCSSNHKNFRIFCILFALL